MHGVELTKPLADSSPALLFPFRGVSFLVRDAKVTLCGGDSVTVETDCEDGSDQNQQPDRGGGAPEGEREQGLQGGVARRRRARLTSSLGEWRKPGKRRELLFHSKAPSVG